MLPDFVLIGAQRSGTTSLARYLGAHPEIYLAGEKEVRFFNEHWDKGLDWYETHFEDAGPSQLKGEASPGYLVRPEAMSRLAMTLPRAKLLAVLRDPADRVWSHYWMVRTRGREQREFGAIIESEIASLTRGDRHESVKYLWNSLYDVHFRSVLELFERNQLHVEVFEDMASSPETVYKRVCSFLGVDSTFKPDNVGVPINRYVTFRSLTARRLANWLGGPMGRLISTLNTKRRESYPELSVAHRTRLDEFFAPHVAQLEVILRMEFDQWR